MDYEEEWVSDHLPKNLGSHLKVDWDALIEEQEKLSEKCEEKHALDLFYSNPHKREIQRLYALKKLDSLGVTWDHGRDGLVVITNNKGKRYTYALRSGKWKPPGRGKKWYYSKGLEHFVENYLNREFD